MALFLVGATLAAVAVTAPAATVACAPTTQDGFRPFGQGLPPVRAKIGTGHVLTGVVISSLDCKPRRVVGDDGSHSLSGLARLEVR